MNDVNKNLLKISMRQWSLIDFSFFNSNHESLFDLNFHVRLKKIRTVHLSYQVRLDCNNRVDIVLLSQLSRRDSIFMLSSDELDSSYRIYAGDCLSDFYYRRSLRMFSKHRRSFMIVATRYGSRNWRRRSELLWVYRVLAEEEILSWMKDYWATKRRHRDADALVNYRISHESTYDIKSSIS